MDPVTHGLVGAAAAQLVAPRGQTRIAALAGGLAAMSADLDVLLTRANDPLYQLESHRQFSHALLFTPLAALLLTAAFWAASEGMLRRKERPQAPFSFGRLYAACLLGYATAGPLDACTSYGTQLLWPFSDARIAWNLVPVVDPIITLGSLLLVGLSIKRQQRRWAAAALTWIAVFLLYGGVQQSRAASASQQLQQQRGHSPIDVVVKPTLGNQILWRVTYIQDGQLYTDGVRTSLFSAPKVYPGESAPLLHIPSDFSHLKGSTAYTDLLRFEKLSEGYLALHPDQQNTVGDARYAMLPTSLVPLWGVEFDPTHADRHVSFLTFRDAGPATRQQLVAMLLDRPLPSDAPGRRRSPAPAGSPRGDD